MKRLKNKKGFSFFEVLIVAALVATISVTLYNAFSNGFKLWDRSNRLVMEEDLAIFFDKFNQELRNSYFFSQIEFRGTKDQIAFPTVITRVVDKKINPKRNQLVQQLGRIEYEFDAFKDTLYRRQANYGQALDGKYEKDKPILTGLDSVKFEYFYTDENNLVKTKIMDELPKMVRIHIEYPDGYGNTRKVSKSIYIPIDEVVEDEEEVIKIIK